MENPLLVAAVGVLVCRMHFCACFWRPRLSFWRAICVCNSTVGIVTKLLCITTCAAAARMIARPFEVLAAASSSSTQRYQLMS
jgi:hypothetical protein